MPLLLPVLLLGRYSATLEPQISQEWVRRGAARILVYSGGIFTHRTEGPATFKPRLRPLVRTHSYPWSTAYLSLS